jgi:hypothetical protein
MDASGRRVSKPLKTEMNSKFPTTFLAHYFGCSLPRPVRGILGRSTLEPRNQYLQWKSWNRHGQSMKTPQVPLRVMEIPTLPSPLMFRETKSLPVLPQVFHLGH